MLRNIFLHFYNRISINHSSFPCKCRKLEPNASRSIFYY